MSIVIKNSNVVFGPKSIIVPPVPLLLDLYPNALIAYSVRKLRTGYLGNCIRVRRSSDNNEQDIGFVNNELNTSGLLSFVGNENGFVSSFYDNVNNYNQTSSISTTQPQIVTNGVVNTNGSSIIKPTLTWSLSRGLGNTNNLTIGSSEIWLFLVLNITTTTVGTQILFEQTVNFNNFSGSVVVFLRDGVIYASQRTSFYASRLTPLSPGRYVISVRLRSNVSFTNFVEFYINGVQATTSTFSNHTLGPISFINAPVFIGARNLSTSSFVGQLQELIVYNSDQSANRQAIETNINNYYGIY
jgi:hypothetical protein